MVQSILGEIPVTFHQDICMLPFKHKRHLSRVFRDVIGINAVDYVGLHIISSDDVMTFFSSNPSLIINQIKSGCWVENEIFYRRYIEEGVLCPWLCFSRETPSARADLSGAGFGYKYGFNVAVSRGALSLVYSFATKSPPANFEIYYSERVSDFIAVGDYLYGKIKCIIDRYYDSRGNCLSPNFSSSGGDPSLREAVASGFGHLRLVVNNTKKRRLVMSQETDSIAEVVKIGSPILHSSSNEVNVSELGSNRMKEIGNKMLRTMHAEGGVGLAAPQVGIDLRLIVFGVGTNSRKGGEISIPDTVVVNPKITYFSDDVEEDYEGCLSVGDVMAKVPRSKRIRYKGFDLEGVEFERESSGFEARIIQHECDHLDGIIFLERVVDKKSFISKEEFRKCNL